MSLTIGFIFILLINNSFAQEEGVPIVHTYSVEDYKAGLENWDAIEDKQGILYFANSEGILEYDGGNWRLIRTDNKNATRSLGMDREGTIYVGGDYDLGYLKENEFGRREFQSLMKEIPIDKRKLVKHIWKVIIFGEGKKLFVSQNYVLVFDQENKFIKAIKQEIFLRSAFVINGQVYAYSKKQGILLLDQNELEFSVFFQSKEFNHEAIEFMHPHPEGGIYLEVFGEGFFRLHENRLTKIESAYSDEIDENYIFCQADLGDDILLGTIQDGIYTVDSKDLSLIKHLNHDLGLADDKVFDICIDHDNNVWVCHENGLSHIEYNTPVRQFNEQLGLIGAGYCSLKLDSAILVGTSHGLMIGKKKDSVSYYEFSFFQNIHQPVFFIEKLKDRIIVGGLLHILEIKGSEINHLYHSRQNKKILRYPLGKEIYLISTENGFLRFDFDDGLHFINHLPGLRHEIKDFEIDHRGNIWLINGRNQLILAELNYDMDSLMVIHRFEEDTKGEDLKFHSLVMFKHDVILGSNKGLYAYYYRLEQLRKLDIEFNHKEENMGQTINWLYNQNDENLWFERSHFENGKLNYNIGLISGDFHDRSNAVILNSIIYGSKAFSFQKYNETTLAIGTSTGISLFDLRFDSDNFNRSSTFIREINLMDLSDTTDLKGVWKGKNNISDVLLNDEVTQITFMCASNFFYAQDKVKYSYILEGQDDEWSKWTHDKKVSYTLQEHGTYTFRVRAKNIYNVESYETSYEFTIEKPWHETLWWYALEIGILLSLMVLSIYFTQSKSLRTSKISTFIILLTIITIFESISELLQDWIHAQGVTVFAFKVTINIMIALSINPIKNLIQRRFVSPKVIKSQDSEPL